MPEDLSKLREKIDGIDCRILQSLNERIQLAAEIGKSKALKKMPVYDPAREEEVLRKVVASNEGPFPRKALEKIFREIISAARSFQKTPTVAFLGPKSTFTHQAALQSFGSSVSYQPYRTIPEIFSAVEREEADYGVVPVENSSQGSVYATLDSFIESPLRILSENYLRIEHCLISNHQLNEIKKVYSKDQALGQCRDWLARNLPQAELIDCSSTAYAVEIASREESAAAIAGILAAESMNVPVQSKSIQDKQNNFTRFLIIGRSEDKLHSKALEQSKTSLLLTIPDKSGALSEALYPFSSRNINLTRIESRPSRRKAWDYIFFVDLIGHETDHPVKEAVSDLQKICPFIKILGSYASAEPLTAEDS